MSKRTVKHFITFMYPGLLFSETETRQIGHRNPREIGQMPRGAFAFQFHDLEYVGAEDDEGNCFERCVTQKPINKSKWFYPGGKILSRSQVEQLDMDEESRRITLSNMDINGIDRVIKTCRGNLQEFHPEDQEIL